MHFFPGFLGHGDRSFGSGLFKETTWYLALDLARGGGTRSRAEKRLCGERGKKRKKTPHGGLLKKARVACCVLRVACCVLCVVVVVVNTRAQWELGWSRHGRPFSKALSPASSLRTTARSRFPPAGLRSWTCSSTGHNIFTRKARGHFYPTTFTDTYSASSHNGSFPLSCYSTPCGSDSHSETSDCHRHRRHS